MSLFEAPSETVFARHETFPPRYGWIKKGFDAVRQDGTIFSRDDAATLLGVGKNMARSIKYWTLAFGVAEEVGSGIGRSTILRTTAFGNSLLQPDGWDPFLEDLGSLWLLHWQLLRRNGLATAWQYAFLEFADNEFTVDDLATSLHRMVERRYGGNRVALSSLRKDAACIVQMYTSAPQLHAAFEESIKSPFVQLDLLVGGVGDRRTAFHTGSKSGLSSIIIIALCLDYMAQKSATIIPLASLLRGAGSPGLATRISESILYEALETVTRNNSGLVLSDSGGIIQLSVTVPPLVLRDELLSSYYFQGVEIRSPGAY